MQKLEEREKKLRSKAESPEERLKSVERHTQMQQAEINKILGDRNLEVNTRFDRVVDASFHDPVHFKELVAVAMKENGLTTISRSLVSKLEYLQLPEKIHLNSDEDVNKDFIDDLHNDFVENNDIDEWVQKREDGSYEVSDAIETEEEEEFKA